MKSALDPSGKYRKLVFRRLPGGSRRLLGGRDRQKTAWVRWEFSKPLQGGEK